MQGWRRRCKGCAGGVQGTACPILPSTLRMQALFLMGVGRAGGSNCTLIEREACLRSNGKTVPSQERLTKVIDPSCSGG